MPSMSKERFFYLTGEDAIPFATFITSDATNAKAMKFIFENIENIDHKSIFVRKMLDMLVAGGIISQVTADNIMQWE